MKILLIGKEDFLGAGKAANRLYQTLKSKKHEVCFLVQNKVNTQDPFILKYDDLVKGAPLDRAKQWVQNRWLRSIKKIKTNPDFYFFGLHDTEIFTNVKLICRKLPFSPDIIIITWVSGFFSPKAVSEMQKITGAKIFAYPMDMSLFTGGCHYAWNCSGYTKNCMECPAITDPSKKNKAAENLSAKKTFYKHAGVKVVVASSQLATQAAQSALFGKQAVIEKRLLPVDEHIFNAKHRHKARTYFQLSITSKVIFFGASFTAEKRKGLNLLIQAFALLKELYQQNKRDTTEVHILIAGHKPDGIEINFSGFTFTFLGYINDENIFSMAYQAATVFVSSSLQDSGPMMVNEAIMCGTPVVAFNLGVAEDLIIPNKTGCKVTPGSVIELSRSLYHVLESTGVYLPENIEKFGNEKTSFSNFQADVFS